MIGFNRILAALRRQTAVAVLVALSASTAFAQQGKSTVNVDENGVMLRGFDAVSYQVEHKPVKGSASFTATRDGAIYYFASAANRDASKADPAKYAPAYGGYCAMGVAVGKKLDGDPAAFTVANGRLYLNVSEKVRTMWSKDIGGNEAKAVKNWSTVRAHRGLDKM